MVGALIKLNLENLRGVFVAVVFFYRNLVRMVEWVALGPGAR